MELIGIQKFIVKFEMKMPLKNFMLFELNGVVLLK